MMTGSAYTPGGGAKAISNVAIAHFGASYKAMFEYHGWPLEDGQQYMHQAASRIVEVYGSVEAFVAHFMGKDVSRAV